MEVTDKISKKETKKSRNSKDKNKKMSESGGD